MTSERNAVALISARAAAGGLPVGFLYPVPNMAPMGRSQPGRVDKWNAEWDGHRRVCGAEAVLVLMAASGFDQTRRRAP